MSEKIYFKRDCQPSSSCTLCTPNVHPPFVFPKTCVQYPQCVDQASYSQWHRRLEAMQHAVQSQAFRKTSGF